MSTGEKQAWPLDKALDAKRDILTMPMPDRDILTMPMPDPNDDSPKAHRTRSLLLAAADSTIEQTIRLPRVEELALPNPSNVSSPELPGKKSGCTIY